jgi:16S rRNA (cytosine967-C5)-methyltransferase
MTPAARLQAAIEVLDRTLAGTPAEKALTDWARASRYAGSGDRAAVRDRVYDVLRCMRSAAARGGVEPPTGRSLVIGALRNEGLDPAAYFTGAAYCPAPLTGAELARSEPPVGLAALDCPDWLEPSLRRALGGDFEAVLSALRLRAPVFLRANLARTTRAAAIARLAERGILARRHDLAPTAIEVTGGASRIRAAPDYLGGLVELQDAASQAAVWGIPLKAGDRVLDLCAGGGGKTLALAGRGVKDVRYHAHDALPGRMKDLPLRAVRAGIAVEFVPTGELDRHAPFDLVLADVPCSGAGTWRRDPAAKWSLTGERLAQLVRVQADILAQAGRLTRSGGRLAYLTCSLLTEENEDQIETFLRSSPDYRLNSQRRILPLTGGDGFFAAILTRG